MHHTELTDSQFVQAFENAALDPAMFNHEAHLRLAWIHLSQYGKDQAIQNITTQLKAYVKKLGAEDKYNETLTRAAILMVHHFMLKTEITEFAVFIQTYPRMKTHFKELIGQHYKTDVFNSAQAKRVWVEPEVLAFD